MSFAQLKKNRNSGFKDLANKMENENKGSSFEDNRFWYPETDKSGNRYCHYSFSTYI
jgi:hypothetical protein